MKKIFFALVLSSLLSIPAFSYTRYEVPVGSVHYAFDIYDAGETVNFFGEKATSTYNLTNNQMSALFDAAKKWTEYINFTPNNLPVYKIYTSNELNASASSLYTPVKNSNYLYTYIDVMMTNRQIKTSGGKVPDSHGIIEVGLGLIEKYPKWSNYDGPSAIFKDPLPDIYSTMIHEMYHSIGLTSNSSRHREKQGDFNFYFSKDENSPIAIWDNYLRIYKGNISSTSYYNPELEIAAAPGMSIKIDNMDKKGTFDILNYVPYFTGPETMKVLTGLNNVSVEDMETYIMSKGGLKNYSNYYNFLAKPPLVLGLPVNVIEHQRPELSHIELRNSFMSHQMYQNWQILMEAELAVLKDLGYDVDLRKYFGQSYYLDNMSEVFTRGYGGVWNEASGTYSGRSTTENGVGLHIYGDNSNITQASDILSDGKYTVGVRIDGVNNSYNLSSGNKIDTAGDGSIGIATMWGKNHTITLNTGSEVTAMGEDGIAASFDFGKNVIGGLDDDRGSYSTYDEKKDSNVTPNIDLQGALVDNFNVAGNLEGKKASIYISENAYVKNINILNGSNLKGDIISEWSSIKTGANMNAQIFDGTSWRIIDGSNPNEFYYTNLNFGDGTNPYNGTFRDNIAGSSETFNTIKMNINGTLNFGDADSIKAIDVYHINNSGILNINGNTSLTTKDNPGVGGTGTINVADGKFLELHGVNNIENTLNLNAGELDTSNKVDEDILISKLVTSNGSKLDIDIGDCFNIIDTTGSTGKTEISSIYANEIRAKAIEEVGTDYSQEIFNNATVDLGTSTTNIYYNGKKYVLGQDDTKQNLIVKAIMPSNGLSDAVADPKALNYNVAEGEIQNTDGGTVIGKSFEIGGEVLDFGGHKGLIVDGVKNPYGTMILTNVKGASEDAEHSGTFTVKNGGKLVIATQTGVNELNLTSNSNIISLDDTSSAEINTGELAQININGAITGESNEDSTLLVKGYSVNLDKLNNIVLETKVKDLGLNGQLSNVNLLLQSGNVTANDDSVLAGGTNTVILNGGYLNLQNDRASAIDLAGLILNGETKIDIDIDITKGLVDTFKFSNEDDALANYGTIEIGDVNFINVNPKTILTKKAYVTPIIAPKYKNTALAKSVVFNTQEMESYFPIFKYKFGFYKTDENTLAFALTRGSGYDSYNPAVMVSPVAAQLGGYLSQLNSYDEAFRNLDMKMLMTREERKAMKMANLYASEVQPQVFSPTYLPEKDSAGWFRPYASFEKVNLNGGPNAENVMYGSYFGGDSKMYETKNGWDYQYSVYIGYNGSHQNYQGNSIYQNGGNIGATGIWYKGDFFTALTANVGASVADASTMYGSEDFPMLMTGVASKTGYNWELAKGRLIIQPSWLMSYTFVNTFDYTNSAGVRIKSDPLHAINMAPGLKFIGNLKHGWQPYLGVQMVWNIMDDTHFRANNVSLPNMSVKPYIQYGVGLQKRWGERFTGFAQAMIRNGGRNGIALSAGLRWAIGKDPSVKNAKNSASVSTRTRIK